MQTCCEGLARVIEEYDLPFYEPIWIERDTHNLKVGVVGIALRNLTPAGNLSQKGRAVLFIRYCPICGAKLRPEE